MIGAGIMYLGVESVRFSLKTALSLHIRESGKGFENGENGFEKTPNQLVHFSPRGWFIGIIAIAYLQVSLAKNKQT